MPDTPDSTRSDLAQLVAESDVEEQSAVNEDGDNGAVSSPAFNFVCSIVGPGILGAFTGIDSFLLCSNETRVSNCKRYTSVSSLKAEIVSIFSVLSK